MIDQYPQISVIMPVYNCEKTILLAVKSVLNQTYKNFEFLIFDDCSTDNTAKIINLINDKRIKFFKSDKKKGISILLNEGIEKARGKYIARMDGDDICLNHRLKRQYNFIEDNHSIDLVASNIIYFKKNKILKISNFKLFQPNQVNFYMRSIHLAHPTWMAKKTFFKKYKYNLEANLVEDQDLLFRAIAKSKFMIIDEPQLFYRIHQNKSFKIQFIKRINFFKAQFNFLKMNNKLNYFLIILICLIIKILGDFINFNFFKKNFFNNKLKYYEVMLNSMLL